MHIRIFYNISIYIEMCILWYSMLFTWVYTHGLYCVRRTLLGTMYVNECLKTSGHECKNRFSICLSNVLHSSVFVLWWQQRRPHTHNELEEALQRFSVCVVGSEWFWERCGGIFSKDDVLQARHSCGVSLLCGTPYMRGICFKVSESIQLVQKYGWEVLWKW